MSAKFPRDVEARKMSKLAVRGIAKSFKGRKVVDGVSFDVEPGRVVGLLGPNGAGKTTSFYMVVGLVVPDEGEIALGENGIGHLPMFQRARIGLSYLPQEASIFRRLTVRENLAVALEAQGVSGSTKDERIEELLKEFRVDR